MGMSSFKLFDRSWPQKLGLAVLAIGLVGILWYFLNQGKSANQSATDLHANLGLSAALTQLEAKGRGEVCWLGDPGEKFFQQYLGSKSLIGRVSEQWRIKIWNGQESCFDSRVKAIVMLFPYVDGGGLPPKTLADIQRDSSELLGQVGKGQNFERQPVTFHLQTGANFVLYTKRK